jgi:hypothetical protein
MKRKLMKRGCVKKELGLVSLLYETRENGRREQGRGEKGACG